MVGGEGKEGDWECSGCSNRNYAFRSFCNRCKQPRLLVDAKTPADSKWLPRIGDWICSGCTNNNYASREKCKKCGQPKELAAMPAIAVPGASLPTHPHYFARTQGGHEQKMNLGYLSNGALQQSLPLSSTWPLGGAENYVVHSADKYGVQTASSWPLGNHSNGVPFPSQSNQLIVSKGWRNGDWLCNCGFHNYASRAQCKKCNASMPPDEEYMDSFDLLTDLIDFLSCIFVHAKALGTKRLASEELVQNWDNKRLNAGHTFGLQQSYPTFGQLASTGGNQTTGVYLPYPGGSSAAAPNLPVSLQLPHSQLTPAPALLGKG
ncbi:hypothetical protein RJ639_004013 [Escallonia herrerae]|uniref:RanBP2-type domain-containing protein n=1 Tax=Escallonia herrerae TaxID=1293975 RepID=A0AA89AV00_9ASTE|nr:hypothetical protein RJ639_004013 [Escallonia herrerae]